MKGIVVDASMALSWCFADEFDDLAEAAAEAVRSHGGVVTPLWWLEVSNVLLQAERRGRLRPAETTRLLAMLEGLPLEDSELDPSTAHLVSVARAHGLTTYDASYLIAAAQHGYHLATRDGQLQRAALAEGVPLITADQMG